jgi:hypothetical protein
MHSETFAVGTCVMEAVRPATTAQHDSTTTYVVTEILSGTRVLIRNTKTRAMRSADIARLTFGSPPEHYFITSGSNARSYHLWCLNIFRNAEKYTVARKLPGISQYERTEFQDFPSAVNFATQCDRSIIYAITYTKRSLALGPEEWKLWLPLWHNLPGIWHPEVQEL